MGYYIDPPRGTKEQFLEEEGHPISLEALRKYTFDQDTLPVCLVHNGFGFTAAGIAYNKTELSRFLSGIYDRKHQWYLVPRDILKPYLPVGKR